MSAEVIVLGGMAEGFDPVLVVHVVVGTVLPFLVGLVTTKLTPGWIKGCLLVGLTLATNVGAELAQALMVGVPFRLVDSIVLSAAQLAYSVALHKSVIAPGPVADWLATHVRKADPNQVLLIEQGWQGPLPDPVEAQKRVKEAAAMVEISREGELVAVSTPAVISEATYPLPSTTGMQFPVHIREGNPLFDQLKAGGQISDPGKYEIDEPRHRAGDS